jgi:hypothetical protein
MTLLDTAIRAAQVADPHFVLARRTSLAMDALDFVLSQPGAPADAVYIYALSRIKPGPEIPKWTGLRPDERSAWEIFRATAAILHRAEQEERAKAVKPRPRLAVPDWMIGDMAELAPGMSDRVSYLPRTRPLALPIEPAPDPVPLPERKKVNRRKV